MEVEVVAAAKATVRLKAGVTALKV